MRSAGELRQINVQIGRKATEKTMWQPVETTPFETDLELAVIDRDGPHALVFPCRRTPRGWSKAETGETVAVRPTHWRPWRGDSIATTPPVVDA